MEKPRDTGIIDDGPLFTMTRYRDPRY